MMMRIVLLLVATLSLASAWVVTPPSFGRTRAAAPASLLRMALDYNDPVVAEEFATVQGLSFEEVEEELKAGGVSVPAMMNDMDAKLMLVEYRLMMTGKMPGSKQKKRPETFSSKFEEYTWTKPGFKEMYEKFEQQGNINSMNVMSEYVNTKEMALARYGKDYKDLIAEIDAVLTTITNSIQFSGFPANMGEDACKTTLEAFGTVTDFECSADEEGLSLVGKVTFEDVEAAKKCISQYDGMDMGMGSKIEMVSV